MLLRNIRAKGGAGTAPLEPRSQGRAALNIPAQRRAALGTRRKGKCPLATPREGATGPLILPRPTYCRLDRTSGSPTLDRHSWGSIPSRYPRHQGFRAQAPMPKGLQAH
jgi:hypothetical protein